MPFVLVLTLWLHSQPPSPGEEGMAGGSIMVGHRYWMPPPRQFQPMFQVLSTINCYATSSR